MSRTNAHRTNHLESISYNYMQDELGPWKRCRKSKCSGTMVPILSRYENKGTIYEEFECCSCGKVIKDPQWKIDRDKARAEQKKNRPRRGRYRGNHNASDNQRSQQRPVRRSSQ